MKNQNPLYIVSNKGKDVERIKNSWHAFFSSLSWEGFVQFYHYVWQFLIHQIDSYATFKGIENLLKQFIDNLIVLSENGQVLIDMILKNLKPLYKK